MTYHRVLSHAFSILLQNCVGWTRPIFGHIEGSSASYDFSKPYFEPGEKTESDGAKISISIFFLGTVYTLGRVEVESDEVETLEVALSAVIVVTSLLATWLAVILLNGSFL